MPACQDESAMTAAKTRFPGASGSWTVAELRAKQFEVIGRAQIAPQIIARRPWLATSDHGSPFAIAPSVVGRSARLGSRRAALDVRDRAR